MNNLMRMGMGQAPQTGPPPDTPQVDTAEHVQISSLALLKMLKHGAFTISKIRFHRVVSVMMIALSDFNVFSLSRKQHTTIHKTGRAGVPMEVMGLMLGQFVDDYTVKVVDVFAMPQSGTGVSVEAVDPVFQTNVGHVETNGQGRNGRRLVPPHPGFGVGWRRYQHGKVLQLNPRLCCRYRSDQS